MRRIAPFLLVVFVAAVGTAQQNPLGAISGVVVDATTGKPIAGAMVQISVAPTTVAPPPGVRILISGSPFRPSRQITDALGRFVFTDVPGANSYTLTAFKGGYFDGAYGRRGMSGVNNQPRRITLAHGQWIRDAKIEMLEPAVIGGSVRNETGEPLVGVSVRAYVDIFIGGSRQLASAANATTDDRGDYRFANLAPGRYVVAVPSTQHSAPADLMTPPPALPQDALSRDSGFRAAPTFALDPVHRLTLVGAPPLLHPTANGIRQAYPLTFHPAARVIADATSVEVEAGDDKGSIDIHLRPVPVYRVSGRLDRQGDAVVRMSLRLMSAGTESLGRGIEQATAMVAADGSFTFLNVPVGAYTLIASRGVSQYSYLSGMVGPEPPGGGGRASMSSAAVFAAPPGTILTRSSAAGAQFHGRQTVVVASRDVMDVAVLLEASVTMSGRIVYEVANPETSPVPVISLEPAAGDLGLGQPRAVRDVDDDPSYFYIEGIVPGSYLLKVMTGGGALKSVKWGDKDYTDAPLEVAGGRNITGVIVTVTDRLTTLGGTIKDRTGQPASNSGVVIFPADRNLWRNFGNQPTRIRYVAGSTTGTYTLRGLPAGDYLIVGIDDANASRWQDPAFFESAARVAVRLSIDWAESKTVDVVLQEIR